MNARRREAASHLIAQRTQSHGEQICTERSGKSGERGRILDFQIFCAREPECMLKCMTLLFKLAWSRPRSTPRRASDSQTRVHKNVRTPPHTTLPGSPPRHVGARHDTNINTLSRPHRSKRAGGAARRVRSRGAGHPGARCGSPRGRRRRSGAGGAGGRRRPRRPVGPAAAGGSRRPS